jgi:tetratricopeptide (TPR) repeat protein
MVLVCLSLGLLAKPMLVTLPFVLLLLDFWPLHGLWASGTSVVDPRLVRRALIEKLPMLALAAGASVVTFVVQKTGGAVTDFEALPLGSRIANVFLSYAIYIRQTLWPTSLAAFYPLRPETFDAWSVAACALALLLATAAALRVRATRPYLVVGWLWFLGTLVPVIGLIHVGAHAHADRYMYIPLIGLGICAAWGATDLARYFGMPRRALGGIAISILSLHAVGAWRQVGVWHDTETLYRHTLSVTEGNFLAHAALGGELLLQGRVDEAEWSFAEAARLFPEWPSPAVGLADVEMARGRLAEALHRYEVVVRKHPENPSAAGRYGLALGLAGRHREAHVQLTRALAKISGVAELHRGMAEVEASLGNPQESVRQGRAALRLMPDHTDAANNLAWTLATCHDPEVRQPIEAIRLVEASALESGDASLLDTLAAAYASAGRYEEAIVAASRAADASRDPEMGRRIRARLALYQEDRPYVEPTPQPR